MQLLAEHLFDPFVTVRHVSVALVEPVGAGVVCGHPEGGRPRVDRRIEELLADASAMMGIKQVDEVQLLLPRLVGVVTWSAARESHGFAVDECYRLPVFGSLFRPSAPQCRQSLRVKLRQSRRAQQVIVGFVPTRCVHAAEIVGIRFFDGPNDDCVVHELRLVEECAADLPAHNCRMGMGSEVAYASGSRLSCISFNTLKSGDEERAGLVRDQPVRRSKVRRCEGAKVRLALSATRG